VEPKKANDPDELGGWRINGRLGEGGFGTVFLAERGAQKAAIKVIRQEFVEEDDARSRLATEAEVLSKLSDPSIGKILDSDLSGAFPWIATEFINGPTLEDKVRFEGPLEEIAWFNLAANIFHAIMSANEFGIIHKDIKPSNIILGETGNKLIDFGIAHISGQTRTATFGGREGSTPFSSPEHFTIRANPKMDVFSTAATLAFAAKGSPIWKGENELQLMRSINEDAPNLDGLTENQIKFLTPLFEKNPSDRPTALNAHQNALGYIEFLLGKSKKPTPLKGRSKFNKFIRSKMALSGVALTLIAGAAYAATVQNQNNDSKVSSPAINEGSGTDLPASPTPGVSDSVTQTPEVRDSSKTETAQTSEEGKRNPNEVKCNSALDANLLDEAIELCLLAAKEKDPRGTFLLGTLYIYKNDDINSEKYLKLAAELGYGRAYGALGVFYENRKKDNVKAEVWYKRGITYKIPENYVTYGLFLMNQEKFAEAEKYFLMADKEGLVWGTVQLGKFYVNQKKFTLAAKYLLNAASAGDAEGMYSYAELQKSQFNDLDTACKWYTSASKALGARSGNYPNLAKSALTSYCQSGLTGTPIVAEDVKMADESVRPYNSEELVWIIPSENIKADFNYIQFKQVGSSNEWKGIAFSEFKKEGSKPFIQINFNSAAKDLCFDFRLIKVEQSKVTKIWNLSPSNCYRFNNGVATKIER
jgi:serine/threonine protein kinase